VEAELGYMELGEVIPRKGMEWKIERQNHITRFRRHQEIGEKAKELGRAHHLVEIACCLICHRITIPSSNLQPHNYS
jgi:hypothetical protein